MHPTITRFGVVAAWARRSCRCRTRRPARSARRCRPVAHRRSVPRSMPRGECSRRSYARLPPDDEQACDQPPGDRRPRSSHAPHRLPSPSRHARSWSIRRDTQPARLPAAQTWQTIARGKAATASCAIRVGSTRNQPRCRGLPNGTGIAITGKTSHLIAPGRRWPISPPSPKRLPTFDADFSSGSAFPKPA